MESEDFLPRPCLLRNYTEGNDGKGNDKEEGISKNRSTLSNKNVKIKNDKDGNESDAHEDDDEEEEEEDEEEEEGEEEEEDKNPNSLEPINYSSSLFDIEEEFCQYRINPLVKIISSEHLSKFRRGTKSNTKNVGNGKNEKNEKNSDDKDSENVVYVVHSSFGNETFESVLRQVVLIPCKISNAANALLELLKIHQKNRQRIYAENSRIMDLALKGYDLNDFSEEASDSWDSTGHITVKLLRNSIPTSSYFPTNKELTRLFHVFTLAGVFTKIPPTV